MNQDFNRVIKTPKYTGVTLSLLSMFVLAAMFVVWQRFPQNQEDKFEKDFTILCDQILKQPVEKILKAFEKEYLSKISVSYLDASLINSISHSSNDDTSDMLICNESILKVSEKKDPSNKANIPFAFEKPSNARNLDSSGQPFICVIKHKGNNSKIAFALARYLSAPSRGQFYLAEAGFQGVDGDQWAIKPTISLMVAARHVQEIDAQAKIFSEREGVNFDISSKNLQDTNSTINLISQSNAREYLADLFIGYGEMGEGNNAFLPILKDSRMNGLIPHSSKFKKTVTRFWKHLINYRK